MTRRSKAPESVRARTCGRARHLVPRVGDCVGWCSACAEDIADHPVRDQRNRRVAGKTPESVRAWGFLSLSGHVLMRTCVDPSERAEFYGGTAKAVRVRIVRESDWRKLMKRLKP